MLDVLREARRRKFLGPGPVHAHLTHARAFHRHRPGEAGLSLDLGSGGGIPGLVLASDRPASRWVLLDANAAKAAFLAGAVISLGLADRVTVVQARAEEIGRDPTHRGRYASVVARSFARPAVVAECGAPLLQPSGLLLVSEPPQTRERWPAAGLDQLGLRLLDHDGRSPTIAALRLHGTCPERFPRRVGIPAKRPLW